jgi:undecaprenyl-diphosphatase
LTPLPRNDLLLGLVQGPAELLPVSSSGHVEAARILLGIDGGDEVGLHAGSLAALVIGCRSEAVEILRRLTWQRVGMHLAAGAVGFALEKRRPRPSGGWQRQLGAAAGRGGPPRRGRSDNGLSRRGRGETPLAGGMLGGSLLLLVGASRRGTRSRWDATIADGVWLGFAQAAALWPGVSRNGSTLAVARLRGFAPDQANQLSREVGVPVTLGAVALRRAPLTAGAIAAFASAYATLPVLRLVDRGGPLWPWALERAGVALLCLRESPS